MRELSPVERLWLIAERLHPPFAITWVVEAPAPADLGVAVEAAAAANPGVRGRLEGWLHRCRWVDSGKAPPVQSTTVPFHPGLLSRVPLAGVDVTAHPNATVFRARHSLLDGRGLQHFVEEVFRALRGEPLLGSSVVGTDLDLAHGLTSDEVGYPPERSAAATGVHEGDATSKWDRIHVDGPVSAVTGRLIAAVTASAKRFQPDLPVCVHVPVDLRREGERTTANRTGVVFIDGSTDPRAMQAAVLEARPQAAAWVRAQRRVRFLPLPVLVPLARWNIQRTLKASRFGATAVVSNLGRLDLNAFGVDEPPAASYFIGPGGPATAAFLAVTGSEAGVDVTCVMPAGLASEGRLQQFMDELREALLADLDPVP